MPVKLENTPTHNIPPLPLQNLPTFLVPLFNLLPNLPNLKFSFIFKLKIVHAKADKIKNILKCSIYYNNLIKKKINKMEYESSDIDWCENNYEYSPYIAEFFNTISNIPYIIFYYVGIYSFKNFYCKNDDKLLYGCLLLIGITSFYFHATLSLLGQLLDEFCIILLLANTLCMIYKDKQYIIKTYTLCHSIVMCFFPFINIPVLFLCGFFIWKILRKRFKKYNDLSYKKILDIKSNFFYS